MLLHAVKIGYFDKKKKYLETISTKVKAVPTRNTCKPYIRRIAVNRLGLSFRSSSFHRLVNFSVSGLLSSDFWTLYMSSSSICLLRPFRNKSLSHLQNYINISHFNKKKIHIKFEVVLSQPNINNVLSARDF